MILPGRIKINKNNIKFYSFIIFNYCVQKFGKSKYFEKLPKIKICLDDDIYCGLFYYTSKLKNTEIHIYLNNNRNLHELVDTILHEYTHYLQDPIKLHKSTLKNGNDNIYESRAINKAKKHTKDILIFISNLKSSYNSFGK